MPLNSTAQLPGDSDLILLTAEVLGEFPGAWVDPMPWSTAWIERVHADYVREQQPVGRLENSFVHELAHAEISLAQLRALSAVIDRFMPDRHIDEAPPAMALIADSSGHPEQMPARAAINWYYEGPPHRCPSPSRLR